MCLEAARSQLIIGQLHDQIVSYGQARTQSQWDWSPPKVTVLVLSDFILTNVTERYIIKTLQTFEESRVFDEFHFNPRESPS